MPSTCNQSATRATAAASSANLAKSADRMLGAICTGMRAPPVMRRKCRLADPMPLGSSGLAEQGYVHRVGSVPVWPQLHIGAVAQLPDARQVRPDVDPRDGLPDSVVSESPVLFAMRQARPLLDPP